MKETKSNTGSTEAYHDSLTFDSIQEEINLK